jgi:CBS domain-containing protein
MAPTARDFMTTHVHTVGAEMDLAEVAAFLLQHKISNVPVVRSDGGKRILVGFISEGDCLEHLANEMFYGNPSPRQTAETIMKRHPVCVAPDADIFALTSIFTNHRYRHLPVVEEQALLGIVSRRDILKAVDRYYREWIGTRQRERFPVDLHEIMNHRFLAGR